MSAVQSPIDRRPSPSFAPSNPFASNNPFRNRVSASSPDLPSPSIRQSRNPFLDVFGEDEKDIFGSGESAKVGKERQDTKVDGAGQGGTEELLINLSIQETGLDSKIRSGDLPSAKPPARTAPEPPFHSHSKSSEYSSPDAARPQLRASRGGKEDRPRRQRSNSESSALASSERGVEKDKRNEKARPKPKPTDRRKRAAPLDIIDKLDVTGIYGGGLFHHDGPFDACNPHRNKNKSRAPMQAFPEGSKNNVLGGFDFDLKGPDHSHVFGNRDPEAYLDFASGRRGSATETFLETARPSSKRAHSFDPINRPIVHGDESLGLGTSTFLEGTPAAKKAIEKAQAEDDSLRPATSIASKDGNGLQRKKSLAQKFRSMSTTKPSHFEGPEKIAPGFDRRHKPSKSGSPAMDGYHETAPPNPPLGANTLPNNKAYSKPAGSQDKHLDEYETAWDVKGDGIRNLDGGGRDRTHFAQTSGHGSGGMENKPQRTGHSDQNDPAASASVGSGAGLLKRVKSMSKGKRRDAA